MFTQQALPATAERDQLEAKYADSLIERLDLAKAVTYAANKNEPVFGWFRFKEGFSRRLVNEVVARKWARRAGREVRRDEILLGRIGANRLPETTTSDRSIPSTRMPGPSLARVALG